MPSVVYSKPLLTELLEELDTRGLVIVGACPYSDSATLRACNGLSFLVDVHDMIFCELGLKTNHTQIADNKPAFVGSTDVYIKLLQT